MEKVENMNSDSDVEIKNQDDEGESETDVAAGSNAREELSKAVEVESSKDIVFYPPVYIQRYLAVSAKLQNIIKESDGNGPYIPKTIFEVGCAEFKMFVYLKTLPTIEKVIFMDIDEGLLAEKANLLRPLPIECVVRRQTPLVVEAYGGSIVKVDQRILDANAFSVIAIEVIEHLHQDVLLGFEKSVFGVIKAPVVFITTPNADFNVLFNLDPGKFRHWDHKFEWTRAEFTNWCMKICAEYPSYSYTIEGIGKGPADLEIDVGCVSQMAIFRRQLQLENLHITENSTTSDIVENGAYKLLTTVEFPFYKDETPEDEQIIRELKYFINCYVFNPNSLEDHRDNNETEIRLPLHGIQDISNMPPLVMNLTVLKDVLKTAGYIIENDADGNSVIVLQIPEECDGNNYSDEDEDASRGLAGYDSIPQVQSPSSQIQQMENDTSLYEEESWE